MKFTLGHDERLKSRKQIAALFERGKQVKVYPLKLTYLHVAHGSKFPARAAFSVPKRNFKKATDRNRVKRLLKEVYRKEKYTLYDSLDQPLIFMITFMGNTFPTYENVEQKMKQLLTLCSTAVKAQNNEQEA